jgi:hypothetical protein
MPSPSSLRVLIAEDHSDTCESLCLFLSRLSFDCKTDDDGLEGSPPRRLPPTGPKRITRR